MLTPLSVNRASPPPSRSEQICKLIIAAILRGEWSDNRRLPTEVELASRYSASRTTVREALSRLRSEGVVVSRRGSGNYIQRWPSQPVPARPQIESIHDIERYYAFRLCVEVGAAELASQARDETDILRMRSTREALHQAQLAGRTAVEEDLALHMAIAHASHNPFFVSTIEHALGPIRQCMELAQNLGRPHGAERITGIDDEHDDIVQSIIDGSRERTAAAMRHHIENARLRIFEGR
ncbi:FadR/GntR family transcriptional regulator [Herbaspirillum sp. alder98]|uniref:FadR/GntR family transcriptional regulator n=1 Tax=Herbaspirillum sp. alder98 TaxID=2913096 RepID=UPI001CD8443E|nr:FadR/GntR family transcriptional regulator [Herbaspirillum sp. alder98]MCA1326876.1 FadR family transcriptional regulator [Herbaspirillum sp. alder98]